ncbi:CPXCG motif-containing cysteine-rich protein [Aestuariicella sp. G3-2]|uniref:CPXCG motif-containing cysteine-rich protein n=1 Tax=Pseudomaricurvus albidus TaxID=2842452 RepID=UPI001C0B9DB4|nr:CPXCG motif-containing cysteine-rich protein [Aestuariicella albida]
MLTGLEPAHIACPYCGETIEVLIDCSVPHQVYIEDCQVCCRPICFEVTVDESGVPSVLVSHENE